jgi:hypothetical protein
VLGGMSTIKGSINPFAAFSTAALAGVLLLDTTVNRQTNNAM